jgi:hypothetical protein
MPAGFEIDLEKPAPGFMFTKADNAKEYTFYLVADKPNFTPAAFEANPNLAQGDDLIFKSPMVEDVNGKAQLNLADHASTIKGKLKTAKTPARAVVVAKARPYCENPNATAAQVQNVTLSKKAESIELKPIVGSVSAADWFTYHHSMFFVEMKVNNVKQVQFEVDPKVAWFETPILVTGVWANDAAGSTNCKKMLMGSVGQGHAPNPKCKCPNGQHDGPWYDLWATQFNQGFRPITVTMIPEQETYIFGLYPRHEGQFVLTVKGVGDQASLVQKVNLSMTGKHPNPGD